jgi:nucleoside-specific outer membrane channel protein Tsx
MERNIFSSKIGPKKLKRTFFDEKYFGKKIWGDSFQFFSSFFG